MNLLDLIDRQIPPKPWAEGEKIPWHDPAFSARMLHEHLSQEHNAASRRLDIIDRHINWLHTEILSGAATKILDLGCGPGLYTSRLAELGHTCVGIDYGPASIAYARQQAAEKALHCTYLESDIRDAAYGTGYGLVMMIHGELNVFRPAEARAILKKAREALSAGGQLLLEVHTLAAVRAMAEPGSSWYTAEKGLFSAQPHLVLKEAHWDTGLRLTTERYYVVDAQSGSAIRHAATIQGYDQQEYIRLLASCGFGRIEMQPSLAGEGVEANKNYVILLAKVLKNL